MAQEEPFKWYLCSFKCMNIEALEWHKKITNGYMCPHCKFRFKDNEKLKNQITLSHNHIKTASMIYLTNNFLSSQVKRYKQISCQWDFTGRRFLSRRWRGLPVDLHLWEIYHQGKILWNNGNICIENIERFWTNIFSSFA